MSEVIPHNKVASDTKIPPLHLISIYLSLADIGKMFIDFIHYIPSFVISRFDYR